ncbi:MAG: DNA polymerase III subunit delta [Paludibacter sp. 47-17]|jgi:DNA polymerase-3 subunit delta'|nr:MAG: DNA polymerase III subunit delta [Paludibacter sp. SCN 50-10]OJX91127.1 MAG: DNA polymerase III subunit delta [Paludibacter sp. 47-17]
MLFSHIIGQQAAKDRLIRTVAEQRIPHAQLFRGPEGIGKLALAIAYAQYICCENRSAADSCGKCPSCVKFAKLAHPDLHLVFPVIKPANKSSVVCDDFVADFREQVLATPYFGVDEWYARISDDAKQGMIYANESQEIIRKLSLKTYESEYKVMIIWLPEKMNNQCSNKLLKILEEPPAKTVFLLVSNHPDEIITTILSRTQHINIPRLETGEIVTALLTRPGMEITQHDALNTARIANGSFLAALNLLKEGDEKKQNFDRFVTVMRLAWKVGNQKDHGSLKTLKRWSDEMAASSVGRERQKGFLAYSQHLIRENFIYNLRNEDLNYLNTGEMAFSRNFSPYINEKNVEALVEEFSLAERHIEQNVNAKMVFFDLMLKIILLLKK